jgi:enamine deaminase RidA (YjgF/YER057c/UK114 family)
MAALMRANGDRNARFASQTAPRDSNEGKKMNTNSTMPLVSGEGSRPAAEQRLKELGIKLPAPPEPFGTYVEAVQTGNLLFLTGMLPTEGRAAKFIGRVGAELDVEAGRQATYLAALNGLAVAREHLGSLDKVTRIVRLGVSVATSGDVRDQPKVADGASELLQDIFGKEKNPTRLVYGVASLPLGAPVELEIIFEVAR